MRTGGESGLIPSLSTWPTSIIAEQYLETVPWMAVERWDEVLSHGADLNTGRAGGRLLLQTINHERMDRVRVRLYAGAGADLNGKLLFAVENRNVQMVRFQLGEGVQTRRM